MLRPILRKSQSGPLHRYLYSTLGQDRSSRCAFRRQTNGNGSLRCTGRLPNFVPMLGALPFAEFHSTPRRQGFPVIAAILGGFKASASFEIVRTASRIALTFIPAIILKNYKSRNVIKYAAIHGLADSEEKKTLILKKIKNRNRFLNLLLLVPFTIFWATIIASLERTPLTGRWRMIILSPEEEDEIAAQLAGPGWFNAVGDILSQDGPPKFIPPSDWRYAWVSNTLRRLEKTIPYLSQDPENCPDWIDLGPDDRPMPPPPEYPLQPRPRASEILKRFCDRVCDGRVHSGPHTITGPPYSLLVVDRPDAANAFSYGFGPDGGGGVVVYSGFLEEIFNKIPFDVAEPSVQENKSWISRLFSGIFSSPAPTHPTPTSEQTTELAILLAHELSHLVLSHHLETLSSGTVIVPGTLSIVADIVRVLIFPFTMLFGPFVNDAVAQLGKVGSGELMKVGEYCTSMNQEIEADVVSARLLAYAGFDAREAVKFWESRTGSSECAMTPRSVESPSNLARRIMGASHPDSDVRITSLKNELERWRAERNAVLARTQTASL